MNVAFRPLVISGLAGCLLTSTMAWAGPLEEGFAQPPDGARPLTWWHWMNGNVTKDGIRADLEDIQRAGLHGVQLFNARTREAAGPLKYGSPEWIDHVKYAMRTAKELGLEFTIMNGAGWSNSGGPWVTPEQSMKTIVWSETPAHGGGTVKLTLSEPEKTLDFYRDICVLAVPADPVDAHPEVRPVMEEGTYADLADGINALRNEKPWVYTYTFPEAVEKASFVVTTKVPPGTKALQVIGRIEASTDGGKFEPVHQFSLNGRAPWQPLTLAFPRTKAKAFRLVINIATYQKRTLEVLDVSLSNDERTENFYTKAVASVIASVMPAAMPPTGKEGSIAPQKVLDLTSQMKPDGSLEWQAPEGDWTILRMGYTTTGKKNHPAPEEGTGLEVDKLSRTALHAYLDRSLGPFLEEKGLFTGVLLDSWEVGQQNWTQKFEEEFKARRGYDLRPWLPAVTGRVMESPAETEAFLADYRRTVSDLVADEYFGGFQEYCRRHGLVFHGEPYDGYCFNEFQAAKHVDVLMTEFWSREELGRRVIEMASFAHIEGVNIVAAEAFTASPDKGKWSATPQMIKRPGDMAFAQGVNRTILHTYAHQPRTDLWPGWSLLFYGINFGRTNPWWTSVGASWVDYISRTQFLLQQGHNTADLLLLQSGDMDLLIANQFLSVPVGYASDRAESPQLIQATAKDGVITLAGSTRYRGLVLPLQWVASTALLEKMAELVQNSVPLVGPPPVAPDRLSDQQNLAAWQKAVKRLWPDGKPRGNNDVAAMVAGLKLPPDCVLRTAGDPQRISWNHRRTDGMDLYFVANTTNAAATGTLELRVRGRQPELWNALTGERTAIPVFTQTETGVSIPVRMEADDAFFVVFREPLPRQWPATVQGPSGLLAVDASDAANGSLWVSQAGSYTVISNAGTRKPFQISLPPSIPVSGPWNVKFQPPIREGFERTFETLSLWNGSEEAQIKYFSGRGTYTQAVEVPAMPAGARALLDLGKVCDVAEVKVNGQAAGSLWCQPFVLDITRLLKAGKNTLEITVTNRAVNRMIGDEQLPDDIGYNKDDTFREFPAWFNDPAQVKARARETFTALRGYRPDSALVEAGLAGPVQIRFQARLPR